MSTEILTVKDLITRNAAERGDSPFIEFYDEVVTYRDLDERSDAVARYLLSKGIGKGDIVAFMVANSPSFFYVLLGAQKIGAIAGPVSCWWQDKELQHLVEDAEPPILIIDDEFAPIVSKIKEAITSVKTIVVNSASKLNLDFEHEYLPEILEAHAGKLEHDDPPTPEDVATAMYTSGTTGKPKGVLHTHRNILSGVRSKAQVAPIDPGDRALCVLPLFHSGGLNDLAYPCMYRALTIVLRTEFSASEFWECVERYKVNSFYIVPTMWNILLRVPEASNVDTSTLRFGLSGAAPIPPEQLEECERRFNVPILEAYGSTENTGGITANTFGARKVGSIGKALPDMEVRIFDEQDNEVAPGQIGEIVTRSEAVMKGYHKAPEATAEAIKDGWLHTGDMGYVDDEGFFFIVDRKKELIIRGGVNVYPKELETVIGKHPAVEEVAVIPEPHDKYGQVAKACVVLEQGKTLTEKELRAYCASELAPYKVPEKFLFRDRLPRNAIGKVIKKELIREIAEEATAEAVPVAHLFEGMPARFIPKKAKGVDAVISYHITGGGGGDWTVTIRDGQISVTEGLAENPRCYVVARDSDYYDVTVGKMSGITAVITGKLSIKGDTGFMRKLRKMFSPVETK
ncbi:MAG: long-chain-fatty-acid--CoA ligase [Myxococcales bacterium]|nr:long-chain-fatty-acid--CoA ligase [Myxococcales bacterium]MDH3483322.1 long-chain-fatty-acid--CoA ligase [Myxococcales bacterium]